MSTASLPVPPFPVPPGSVTHIAKKMPPAPLPQPELNWLFLDLNSYFASVEQEVRPELRNRPVAVVPSLVNTTCCIAASYEAKAQGVKTGTMVKDAKDLCPGIVLIEGRHELYTEYHHRIIAAVQTCLPVTTVLSIDEMACRLIGRERPLLAAMALGRRVKDAIRRQVGSSLRCSVGLATNRYLAKVAGDMEKPDGLVALTPDILRPALAGLQLQDLPGVGKRTEKRLNDKGIRSMEALLQLNREQMGELWGSVWGERLWHWLNGDDFAMDDPEHAKSVGHQHVLAPALRNPESAWAVAHKLLHKAAMRMREDNLWAARIGITVAFVGEGKIRGSSPFGPAKSESWSSEMRLLECQDSATLIAALRRLWDQRPQDPDHQKPYFIGVTLSDLVPDALHSLTLFDAQDGSEERQRLAEAMDQMNHKYGLSTVAPAAMLAAFKAAPTRIAFHSVPNLFDHADKGISNRL